MDRPARVASEARGQVDATLDDEPGTLGRGGNRQEGTARGVLDPRLQAGVIEESSRVLDRDAERSQI